MTCQAEAPAVAAAHEKFGDRVTMVGIAGRDDIDAINEFIEARRVGVIPHVVDDSGEIWASYGIVTQPSFVFVAADGSTSTHIGALGVDGLSSRLTDLIEEPA